MRIQVKISNLFVFIYYKVEQISNQGVDANNTTTVSKRQKNYQNCPTAMTKKNVKQNPKHKELSRLSYSHEKKKKKKKQTEFLPELIKEEKPIHKLKLPHPNERKK